MRVYKFRLYRISDHTTLNPDSLLSSRFKTLKLGKYKRGEVKDYILLWSKYIYSREGKNIVGSYEIEFPLTNNLFKNMYVKLG